MRTHHLLLLMAAMTVLATLAAVTKNKYKKLETGRNMTGNIRAELGARSKTGTLSQVSHPPTIKTLFSKSSAMIGLDYSKSWTGLKVP